MAQALRRSALIFHFRHGLRNVNELRLEPCRRTIRTLADTYIFIG